MSKSFRIFGIIATCFFLLSMFFKLMHWHGAAIIMILSVLIFILIYLPIQLVLEFRKSEYRIQKAYMIIRFITFFTVFISFTFKTMHFPGAGILYRLAHPLIFIYLITYFLYRKSNKAKLPLYFNDLIISTVTYAIFIWINIHSVSPGIVSGYIKITEDYKKSSVGLRATNDLIYNTFNNSTDVEFSSSINEIKLSHEVIFNYIDSIKDNFTKHCTGYSYSEAEKRPYLLHSKRTNVTFGNEFFLENKNGELLKRKLILYKNRITQILAKHDRNNPLIDVYLDLENTIDFWGQEVTWERNQFNYASVAGVFSSLELLENSLLIIENNSLGLLVNNNNSSEMSQLLAQLGKKEADLAIEKQKNELERTKQQQAIKDLELEASKAELTQQTTLTVVAFIGIAFVMVLLIISTRAFVKKQRDAKKLGEQKKEIEKNHYEISASIDYAKRLQSSILPTSEILDEYLNEHFVYFNPKDKVSGDFYWWTHVEGQTIITAADCTGHGVPGAFMSMLGISLLREIVTKEYITHPGVILRKLRKEVVKTLKQKGEVGEQKDGMDISIISINNETKECQYAGANNALYLVRNKELIEYKPDKMPIAIYQRMDNFTCHDIQLQNNDSLYLFSDGFADQFGGENGKKFKYKPFKKLLVENSELPLEKQKTELESAFNSWKQSLEQIDDVVVLGVKV